jgi:hypothetical protein
MNRLDVVKESTHSHPPIQEDHGHEVDQNGLDEDSAVEESESSSSEDNSGEESEEDQDGMVEDSAEEESESSSSEDNSREESEEERWEWVPWQEDTEDEGTDEETSENEEDEVDGYTILHDKIGHYKSILRTLRESTPWLRESVFSSADKGLISLLSEICWNVLEGNVDLSKQDRNLLKIFREQIRVMGSENISWQDKRDFLIENPHDACLPVLLTVMKPFIGTP